MKLVIATPYPEGSTLAIARAASRSGSLEALYISELPEFIRGLLHFRGKDVVGVPSDHLRIRGAKAELTRALLTRVPGMTAMSSRTMYAAKMAFDRAVARELPAADAVVGVFGSCAATLEVARRRGSHAVLNFVNSHPVDHNRLLADLGKVRRGSQEFVPERIAARVERELNAADLILVPSEFVARQLAGRVRPTARIAVLPYGVDAEAFRPRMERASNGSVTCLYVGQLSHRKGIPGLLRAAANLPDIEFTLAGPMVSRDALRGIPSNVRTVGARSHAEIARMMGESDIFVLPSIEDSYGLVVLEAMASGLPVVVTDHAGASESVAVGVNGIIVPAGDDATLAAAIRRLSEDSALRSAMGRAGRSRALSAHSWDAYGGAVIAMIGDALAKPAIADSWTRRGRSEG